ncbi:hypothetical protein FQN54_003110 [Arachnomyces sp. PD_36]|nr:hypothetical protein FQN54_003110 [Arachnomyces sp. PD_36]
MSIQRLPPELLLLTIEYLGASFFHEDVRRLTLFKLWYPFARSVLLEDLKVSFKTLGSVFSAPGAEETLESLKSTVREVEFAFRGLDCWDPIFPPPRPGPGTPSPIEAGSTSSAWSQDLKARAQWISWLDDNLSKMTSILSTCHKLHTLRFKAFRGNHYQLLFLPRPDYIHEQTMSRLLSLSNLTTLEMDTCGTSFLPPEDEGRQRNHICLHISRLLPQLHCLRLRMRHICHMAFTLPDDCDDNLLKLSELIVNLSFTERPPKVQYSKLCSIPDGDRFITRYEIEEMVGFLVEDLDCPRIVRVLSLDPDTYPPTLQSLDVLTGERIDLPNRATWLGNVDEYFDSESD